MSKRPTAEETAMLAEAVFTRDNARAIEALKRHPEWLALRDLDLEEDGPPYSLLVYTIHERNDHLACWLIDNGAPIEDPDHNPLHAAATHYALKVLRRLIKTGANVNALNQQRRPAAAYAKHYSVLKELLEAGADPNALCGESKFPLIQVLLAEEDPTLAELLLEYGADPNQRSGRDSTALHEVRHAKMPRQVSTVYLYDCLVQKGGDVNAQSGTGDTVLHSATRADDADAVSYLIKHGAAIDALDFSKMTALAVAIENGHLNAARRLVDLGANPLAGAENMTPMGIIKNPDYVQRHSVDGLFIERLTKKMEEAVRQRADARADALPPATTRPRLRQGSP